MVHDVLRYSLNVTPFQLSVGIKDSGIEDKTFEELGAYNLYDIDIKVVCGLDEVAV